MGGGAKIFDSNSMRSNSLACCEADSGPVPRFSRPPLKRSACLALPICSIWVMPAPGTRNSASFSLRSMVKW